jgi:serine/threonine protein kinase
VLAARRMLRVGDAALIGIHVCRALAQAHANGVVHRDVKPGNIFLVHTFRGEFSARLIDFGISALLCPGDSPVGIPIPESKITKTGEFCGTPEYVAPESFDTSERVDRRSDLYSLAITLYECLTGSVPYSGNFTEVLAKAMLQGPSTDVRKQRPEVPESLAQAIAGAMSVSADDRFESALEMEHALTTAVSAGSPILLLSVPASAPLVDAGTPLEPSIAPVQRRRFPRKPFITPVLLLRGDQQISVGRSEDISINGMLVVADHDCATGAELNLRFAMPISGVIVDVGATVRWSREGRGKVAIGLQFLNLADSHRREIADLVASRTQTEG